MTTSRSADELFCSLRDIVTMFTCLLLPGGYFRLKLYFVLYNLPWHLTGMKHHVLSGALLVLFLVSVQFPGNVF